jgi:DNA-damage-inducible protein J
MQAMMEVVKARIDSQTKKRASEIMERLGLSLSDAIRLMMLQIVERKGLPFAVEVPNRVTRKAVENVRKGAGLRKVTLEQLKKEWDDA